MQCGISTACFFPNDTYASLKCLLEAGVRRVELFLNTFQELDDAYIKRIQLLVQSHHAHICSLHPFSSAMETFFFASPYKTRMKDGLHLYHRFFEVCQILNIDKLVFHGDHLPATFPVSDFAAHLNALAKAAKQYRVTLCLENVFYCRFGDPLNIQAIYPLLDADIRFVLDLKQLHRFGAGLESMLDAMDEKLCHIHISDFTNTADCITPGTGQFDFNLFIHKLHQRQYAGDLIIELYRDGFGELPDLLQSQDYIRSLLKHRP